MEKEELLKVLSDVNINSETAVQAVELYVKFFYTLNIYVTWPLFLDF